MNDAPRRPSIWKALAQAGAVLAIAIAVSVAALLGVMYLLIAALSQGHG